MLISMDSDRKHGKNMGKTWKTCMKTSISGLLVPPARPELVSISGRKTADFMRAPRLCIAATGTQVSLKSLTFEVRSA